MKLLYSAFTVGIFISCLSNSLNARRNGAYHEIDSIEEYNGIVKNGQPTVMYCHSHFCEACKTTDDAFAEIAQAHQHHANFVKINLDKDELKPIGAKNEIQAVPTTIIKDRQGKNIERIRGSREKKEYKESIQHTLNNNKHNISSQVSQKKSYYKRPRN